MTKTVKTIEFKIILHEKESNHHGETFRPYNMMKLLENILTDANLEYVIEHIPIEGILQRLKRLLK